MPGMSRPAAPGTGRARTCVAPEGCHHCRGGRAAMAAGGGEFVIDFAEYPMATLVLDVNREALHHGAEIALLRDLYANR
jgi:hypothetical protein